MSARRLIRGGLTRSAAGDSERAPARAARAAGHRTAEAPQSGRHGHGGSRPHGTCSLFASRRRCHNRLPVTSWPHSPPMLGHAGWNTSLDHAVSYTCTAARRRRVAGGQSPGRRSAVAVAAGPRSVGRAKGRSEGSNAEQREPCRRGLLARHHGTPGTASSFENDGAARRGTTVRSSHRPSTSPSFDRVGTRPPRANKRRLRRSASKRAAFSSRRARRFRARDRRQPDGGRCWRSGRSTTRPRVDICSLPAMSLIAILLKVRGIGRRPRSRPTPAPE